MTDNKEYWVEVDEGKCIKLKSVNYMEIKVSDRNEPNLVLKTDTGDSYIITNSIRATSAIKSINNPILIRSYAKLFPGKPL